MRSSGDSAQTLSWHSLAVVRGSYSPDDCVNDMAEIKFDRPVAIKVSSQICNMVGSQENIPIFFSFLIIRKALAIPFAYEIRVERRIMGTVVLLLSKVPMELALHFQLAS